MLIYIILLIVLMSLALLNPYIRHDRRTVFLLFLFSGGGLAVFSGIRYDVGVDYLNYKQIYDDAVVLAEKQREIGFAWFFHLCRIGGIPFEVIILFFSALTVGMAFRFIKQYSPFVFFSVFLFYSFGQYYFNSFNAIRQTLAIYIFLSSLPLIQNRKWKAYFLLVGISVVFIHASALLLLPLYFILHRRYSFYFKSIFLVLFVLGTEFIVKLIGMSNYAIYLKLDMFASEVNTSTYFLLVQAIGVFVWGIFQEKKLPEYRLLFNVNYIALLMLILVILFRGTPLIMVANRFSYYFTPVCLVMLPLAVARFHRTGNQFLLILFWVSVYTAVFLMALVMNGESNNLVPYQTIFNL